MNVFDAPNIQTERYINLYAVKVLKVDQLTKTATFSIIFDDDLIEISEGTQLFTFLTNVQLEKALFNESS